MIGGYVQDKQLFRPRVYLGDRGRGAEADEILRVLNRAALDDEFIAQLTEQGSKALQGYDLSRQAKAALVSGDIRWVEARVGTLNARQRTWLVCRLQQERW